MFQDPSFMVTIGKWMLCTLFIVAGILNCIPPRPKDHIERMAGFGVPLPAFAFWFGSARRRSAKLRDSIIDGYRHGLG